MSILSELTSLFTTLGFPIASAIALGLFCYYIVKKNANNTEKIISDLQKNSKEREDKLMQEIENSRRVNEKAIDTIARYDEKLDAIENDVKDIKTNTTLLIAHKN